MFLLWLESTVCLVFFLWASVIAGSTQRCHVWVSNWMHRVSKPKVESLGFPPHTTNNPNVWQPMFGSWLILCQVPTPTTSHMGNRYSACLPIKPLQTPPPTTTPKSDHLILRNNNIAWVMFIRNTTESVFNRKWKWTFHIAVSPRLSKCFSVCCLRNKTLFTITQQQLHSQSAFPGDCGCVCSEISGDQEKAQSWCSEQLNAEYLHNTAFSYRRSKNAGFSHFSLLRG